MIDFFALSKSDSRPDYLMIHPSISTCYNERQLITSQADADLMLGEFQDGNFAEKVLTKHHMVRRFNFNFYIKKYELIENMIQ